MMAVSPSIETEMPKLSPVIPSKASIFVCSNQYLKSSLLFFSPIFLSLFPMMPGIKIKQINNADITKLSIFLRLSMLFFTLP